MPPLLAKLKAETPKAPPPSTPSKYPPKKKFTDEGFARLKEKAEKQFLASLMAVPIPQLGFKLDNLLRKCMVVAAHAMKRLAAEETVDQARMDKWECRMILLKRLNYMRANYTPEEQQEIIKSGRDRKLRVAAEKAAAAAQPEVTDGPANA